MSVGYPGPDKRAGGARQHEQRRERARREIPGRNSHDGDDAGDGVEEQEGPERVPLSRPQGFAKCAHRASAIPLLKRRRSPAGRGVPGCGILQNTGSQRHHDQGNNSCNEQRPHAEEGQQSADSKSTDAERRCCDAGDRASPVGIPLQQRGDGDDVAQSRTGRGDTGGCEQVDEGCTEGNCSRESGQHEAAAVQQARQGSEFPWREMPQPETTGHECDGEYQEPEPRQCLHLRIGPAEDLGDSVFPAADDSEYRDDHHRSQQDPASLRAVRVGRHRRRAGTRLFDRRWR